MRICIAQTHSFKGEVHVNRKNHLRLIKEAVKHRVDLIVFPELSITNYEPTLAKQLALDITDAFFKPFHCLADYNRINIAVGMPSLSGHDASISMYVFMPGGRHYMYSKQLLHEDEKAFFVPGNHSNIITINGIKLGLGICYESLQKHHIQEAVTDGADIYIASVAKSQKGVEQAYTHFAEMSKKFNLPIVMGNSIGTNDDFVSYGKSAVWDQQGLRLNQLDSLHVGLLIYDHVRKTVDSYQLHIKLATLLDIESVYDVYLRAKNEMVQRDIHQWNDHYPTRGIVEADILNKDLYILYNGSTILGAITLNQDQEEAYKTIAWEYDESKVLVIHRLVIDPTFQRKGYANYLMDFAERYASKRGYTSIRLDAYSANQGVQDFYRKRGYVIRGDVYFDQRKHPFHCLEKDVC